MQNSIWTLDSSDDGFYIFTTTEVIAGKEHKSFGLTGVLTPANTQGMLTISTTIVGGSGVKSRSTTTQMLTRSTTSKNKRVTWVVAWGCYPFLGL